MWHEVVLLNINELVPSVKVPIIFFCGKHDMNHPTILVKEYYDGLDGVNGKEFILFEHSAHGIFWDEPEKIENEIIKALDRFTTYKH